MFKAVKFEEKNIKEKEELYKKLSNALKTKDQIAEDMLNQVFKNGRKSS